MRVCILKATKRMLEIQIILFVLLASCVWAQDHRICTEKNSGKLIEMQSGGKIDRLQREKFKSGAEYQNYLTECNAKENMRLNTLKQNALNSGHKENDIEVNWISNEEWAVKQADLSKPTPEQIAEREKEALIQAKIKELAIAALKVEGKLDASGSPVKK